jgi:hypothetical protein
VLNGKTNIFESIFEGYEYILGAPNFKTLHSGNQRCFTKASSGFRDRFRDQFSSNFGFSHFRSNSKHHRFTLIDIFKKAKIWGPWYSIGIVSVILLIK